MYYSCSNYCSIQTIHLAPFLSFNRCLNLLGAYSVRADHSKILLSAAFAMLTRILKNAAIVASYNNREYFLLLHLHLKFRWIGNCIRL